MKRRNFVQMLIGIPTALKTLVSPKPTPVNDSLRPFDEAINGGFILMKPEASATGFAMKPIQGTIESYADFVSPGAIDLWQDGKYYYQWVSRERYLRFSEIQERNFRQQLKTSPFNTFYRQRKNNDK